MKKTNRFIANLLVLIILVSALSGCEQTKSPVTKTGVYFDTVISITLYEKNSSQLIDECFKLAEKYENLLSKTVDNSDVYRINKSSNEWVQVDKETYDIIKTGLKYEELSDGHFSVMCGALTDLWDIPKRSELASDNKSGSSIVPTEEEINTAVQLCGIKTIELNDETCSVKIVKKGAKLDLGAIAKGYIADMMKAHLLDKGVEHGIIQLGGNVLLIGDNPTKSEGYYTIGISRPFSDEESVSKSAQNNSDIITTVTEKDTSIVTSGNYQRYFKYKDTLYHHIIDLKTGYPASTGLNSVTIICENSVDADCLSTVCFLYGKQKSDELINMLNTDSNSGYTTNIKAIYVSDTNEVSE